MSSAQIPVTVATASGRITGVRRDGLHYFHSVRYSTIPSPYSPAEPLQGTRDQDAREPRPNDIALSITAPADAAECPVVVYIHGGRFEHGSHEDPRLSGEKNARHGVIQVNVGYRVGLAGFARFDGDEADRYRGIDDCLLALEWLQDNIEAFGGDKTNITLVGQSAGAAMSLWLARRDHFRGGFRRVLALSPAFPRDRFEHRVTDLRRALGVPVTREALEKMDPESLAKGYAKFRKKYRFDVALGPAPLRAEELADIPIVVTSTRDEFYTMPAAQRIDKMAFAGFITSYLSPKFGMSHDRFKQWRQLAHYVDPQRPMGRLIGDAAVRRWTAQVAEEAPGPTWMMEFTRTEAPAVHCAELDPLFGGSGGEEADASPAGELNEWLRHYATTGEPGFPGYGDDHQVLEFNLDTGERRLAYATLDYVAAAFYNDDELGV